MKHLSIKTLTFLSLSLVCITTGAFADQSGTQEPHFLEKIADKISEKEFNGTFLFAKGDNVIYQKSFGTYGDPQTSSQFLIASISKQFSATVLLQLVDQGLLNLDQPLSSYLSDLTQDWASSVTVRELLNHTSGIEALDQPLLFQPGTEFKYSSTLTYDLARQVAEQVSGKPFETLLTALFQQANLPNTGFLQQNLAIPDLLASYPVLVDGYVDGSDNQITEVGYDESSFQQGWLAGGGLISTTPDLLRWNLALHGNTLLSQESYTQMTTPSITYKNPRYGKIGYGLGLQILDKHGYVEFSHSGYADGYMSTLLYYPSEQITLVILENISRDPSDLKKAFRFHDELRKGLRAYIGIHEVIDDVVDEVKEIGEEIKEIFSKNPLTPSKGNHHRRG